MSVCFHLILYIIPCPSDCSVWTRVLQVGPLVKDQGDLRLVPTLKDQFCSDQSSGIFTLGWFKFSYYMLYRNDNCTLYHSTCSLLLLYSTTAFSPSCCRWLWQQHNSVPDCVLPHCDHCGQVAIAIIALVSSIVSSGAVAVTSDHPVHVAPLFSIVLCHPLITGTVVDMSPSLLSCLCHRCFVIVVAPIRKNR